MIISEAEVADYYEKRNLHSRIITSLQLAGIEQPAPQDLSAVDEFHIGGTDATRFVSAALSPTPSGKFWTLVAALADRHVSLLRIRAVM